MESDFSAIHRVDNIYEMNGPDFFKKAYRMSAYQGVMKLRVMDQMEKDRGDTGTSRGSAPAPRGEDEVRNVDAAQMLVEYAGLFELGAA